MRFFAHQEQDIIPTDDDGDDPLIDRSKRLSSSRIRDSWDRLKTDLSTTRSTITEPLLGSIRSSSLLKSKSNRTSFLDTYSKSIATGLSKGISLFPLMSTHQTDPVPVNCTQSSSCNCTQTPAPQSGPAPPCATNVRIAAGNAKPNEKPPTGNANSESSVGSANPNGGQTDGSILEAPIVQPTYLMDDKQISHKRISKEITNQQRRETAALRNEINYAVKHNLYAHTSAEALNNNNRNIPNRPITRTTTTAPKRPTWDDDSDVFSFTFWRSLLGRSKSRHHSLDLFQLGDPLTGSAGPFSDPIIGSARSDFSYVPPAKPTDESSGTDELPGQPPLPELEINESDSDDDKLKKLLAQAAAEAKKSGIISNTVESYVNKADGPSIGMSQVRETLVMKSITEDSRFNIGENVIAWKTLKRNNRERHALIGITNTSVVLVLEKNNVYTLQSEYQLLTAPTSFATFTYWNHTRKSIEGVVIVSIQHEVVFLRVNEAMTKMVFSWQWPTIQPAKFIKHFLLDNTDVLLIITDTSTSSAANLYRFDMIQREFFLRESLPLKKSANTAEIIHTGRDTFLFIPQFSQVTVYKHIGGRFKFFVNIPSSKTEIISVFEMGGHIYIAIGGNKPKILRYHHGEFHDQTILAENWGFVEYFLPVSARTYRDDLILIIQHRIDYGKHTNSYVEALIWNGEAFDPALAVPCFVNDRPSNVGIGCMIDQERDLGIIGATTFIRNRTISVIVPRQDAPSGLFDLKFELTQAEFTYNEHLLEMLSEVLILLDTRDEILKNANNIIRDFHPDGSMKEITIKNQQIDTINTKELDLGTIIPTDGILYNGEVITQDKIDRLERLVSETEKNLEKLNREKREIGEQNFELKSVDVTDLYVDFINDIPIEDLLFMDDNRNLFVDGIIEVTKFIEADHVAKANLASSIEPILEEIRVASEGTTVIAGDLNFEEINGIKWSDLIDQIVLKNMPNFLDEIDISGVSEN